MKKSKFEKLISDMIDCEKKFMDACNEVLQSGVIKDEYQLRDFGNWYENASDHVAELEQLKKVTTARDLKVETIFGLPIAIDLEEDEEKKD